jgi:hypothetical protein
MTNWFSWLKTLAPIILALIPKTQAISGRISDAIGAAEGLVGASGADKKASVMQIAADAVASVNTVAGTEKLPPAETLAATSDAIDTIVDIVNAVSKHTAEVPKA